jgi:hypothetical protein
MLQNPAERENTGMRDRMKLGVVFDDAPKEFMPAKTRPL